MTININDDQGIPFGTPEDEIPEDKKIHVWTHQEMMDRYKDVFDYFAAWAVLDDFPDGIHLKTSWIDGRLHIRYVDYNKK